MKLIFFASLYLSVNALAALYASPEQPYHFEYDEAKWELITTPKGATQDVDKKMEGKTLTVLQRKDADEKYRARVNVVVDDPHAAGKGKVELADYAKHAVDFMKSQRFDVHSAEAKILPRLGVPAFEILASQRDFGLSFRQVVFLWGEGAKQQAYLLTASTRTNKFDAYKPELDAIFNSFAMKQ